ADRARLSEDAEPDAEGLWRGAQGVQESDRCAGEAVEGKMMPKQTPADPWRRWHRLFGLLLTDHLRNSPFTVELEKDLSHRQQLLDVVVVRRGAGAMSRAMPDGLQDLA